MILRSLILPSLRPVTVHLTLFPSPDFFRCCPPTRLCCSDAKHHDSIFKLFKRLHVQEMYCGGTGAGLAIARKMVEKHGGNLWVESVSEAGASFYFTLPKSL